MDEFKAKFVGSESIAEFLATQSATKSASLKWYVDVYSPWPRFLQYAYIWFKRTVLRMSLDE